LITIALASIRQLVTSPRIYAKKGTTSNSRSLKLCVYFLDKGTKRRCKADFSLILPAARRNAAARLISALFCPLLAETPLQG
ncbi:hypothetical protein, partial [Paenibacillus cymbidii]|uniref:hypothetical protein n=1 Tax=Paenibacillus cymbidii TaxID=1639034 RepID=UPI001A9B1D37